MNASKLIGSFYIEIEKYFVFKQAWGFSGGEMRRGGWVWRWEGVRKGIAVRGKGGEICFDYKNSCRHKE